MIQQQNGQNNACQKSLTNLDQMRNILAHLQQFEGKMFKKKIKIVNIKLFVFKTGPKNEYFSSLDSKFHDIIFNVIKIFFFIITR